MTIWILLALMTGAAVLAVSWPFTREPAPLRAEPDIGFYREQLAEIRRDRDRGLLPAEEAGAAEAEAGRRLLRATRLAPATGDAVGEPALRRRRAAWALALSVVPLVAIAIYGTYGSPHMPGEPLAARVQAEMQRPNIATALARIESHLAEHADDLKGWDLVAPVYLRLGRFADSVKAYEAALRLGGDTAERLAGYGEALVGAGDGIVSAQARATFDKALAMDPSNPRSHFFLGLAAEQDGHPETARAEYEKVLALSPANAPWLSFLKAKLARFSGEAAPGTTQPNVPAAQPPLQSNGAQPDIRGMVAGLDARLESQGGTLDEWTRLIRSYVVLGERDKAMEVLARARAAKGNEAGAAERLDGAAREFGLDQAGARREGTP